MRHQKILIADDDAITRRLLEELVTGLGHQVVMAHDGGEALAVLQGRDAPGLALIDWVMPVLDGPEVCRALRSDPERRSSTYLILLTARSRKSEVVAGLRAGADDYVIKPFDPDELAVRIEMGIRTACLERRLRAKTREAEAARERLRRAEDLLPCAGCRQVREDGEYWDALSAYRAGQGDDVACCRDCLLRV